MTFPLAERSRSPRLCEFVPIQQWRIDRTHTLAFAVLSVAGGLTRTVGNRITLAFGLVGGLAHALAAVTIPFTDGFDSLFKVGSLLAVGAILVGGLAIRERA